jgi:hypothetical protein
VLATMSLHTQLHLLNHRAGVGGCWIGWWIRRGWNLELEIMGERDWC